MVLGAYFVVNFDLDLWPKNENLEHKKSFDVSKMQILK